MGHIIKKFIQNYYFKKTLLFILLFMLFFLMVWARAYYGSMRDYQKGESFLNERKYIRAITYFDRSIHWYTPFNPYVQKSIERLWEIGVKAENQGDIKLALIAYRTIRGGLYGGRSFYTPYKGWLQKSELRISELMTLDHTAGGESDKTSWQEAIAVDQKVKSPSILWSILLEVGFLGWVGSVIGFIGFVLGRKENAQYSSFLSITWIGLSCIFFTFWIIGMIKA